MEFGEDCCRLGLACEGASRNEIVFLAFLGVLRDENCGIVKRPREDARVAQIQQRVNTRGSWHFLAEFLPIVHVKKPVGKDKTQTPDRFLNVDYGQKLREEMPRSARR